MPEETLRLKVETKGADKAAQEVAKVGEAKAKLEGQSKAEAKGVDATTEAQQKLNAAESDYVGILTRISPMWGGLLDSMLKGAKISGDLASKQLSLSGILDKAKKSAKSNAAALKLIGAGGAVALAVLAIAKAFSTMREEAERATSTIRDQIDALNEAAKLRGERQADIERMSAARAEGPYTAEESARADEALERLREQTGTSVDEAARVRAVLLTGADASTELLEKVAILIDQFSQGIDFDKLLRARPQGRLDYLNRLIEHRAAKIETVTRRERVQRGETAERARAETLGMGSTADIERFIRELPGKGFEGEPVEQIARIVQALRGLDTSGLAVNWKALWRGEEYRSPEFRELQVKAAALERGGIEGVSEHLVRLAEQVLQQLQKAPDRLETAAKLNEAAQALKDAAETLASTPSTVINNLQHSKLLYPSARTRLQETNNGQNYARSRGG